MKELIFQSDSNGVRAKKKEETPLLTERKGAEIPQAECGMRTQAEPCRHRHTTNALALLAKCVDQQNQTSTVDAVLKGFNIKSFHSWGDGPTTFLA